MDSFEINEAAKNLFNNSMPLAWLKREQNPDVHVDYSVELREKSEPTGKIFYVQLKGCENPKYTADYLKYSLKSKHLSYYQDRLKIPVFLMVFDIKNKKGYWVFLQKYLNVNAANKKWEKKGSLTIKIPLANCIDDIELLKREIVSAEAYMRELWPGSIEAAIKAEKERLENIDNRFAIDVSYQGDATHVTLIPKQDVNIQFFTKSVDGQSKFRELFESGKEVEFSADEVGFSGSALLEEIQNKFSSGRIKLSAKKSIDCTFAIYLYDSHIEICKNEDMFSIVIPNGKIEGGSKEAHFTGKLMNSPLTLSGELSFDKLSHGRVNITFDYKNWSGQNILHLGYFDKLKRFFNYLKKEKFIAFSIERDGNSLLKLQFDSEMTRDILSQFFPSIEILEKARIVCEHLGVNPVLPEYDQIKECDFEQIDLIHKIITDGKYEIPMPNARASATFKVPNENLSKFNDNAENSILKLCPQEPSIDIFGTKSSRYVILHTITNVKFSDESLQKIQQIDSEHGEIHVDWITGPNSTYTKELVEIHQIR